MVSPLLAAGVGMGLAGGASSMLGSFGKTGTGQAGKMYERQANLAKKSMNIAQNALSSGELQAAKRAALSRGAGFPSMVAPFAPETEQAFGVMRNAAAQPTGAGDIRSMGMATARGDYLHPGSNPYLAGAIEAATRPTIERLTESALPGVHSAAISSGAYGGNAPDLINQAIIRDANREALDISNRMAFENYGQERDRQFQAGNVLQQASALEMLPAQYLSAIGGAKEAKAGQQLAEGRERYDAETAAIAGRPLAGLDEVMALARGAPTMPITNQSPNLAQIGSNVLQGTLGGAMTGMALSPMLAQFMPQQIQSPRGGWGTTGQGGAGFQYPYYGGPR